MLGSFTRRLLGTSILWFAAATPAQLTVELVDVPGDLVYPLPAGHNAMVTAIIHGGEAEQVWLAATGNRLVLRRAAPHRYQLNLADAAVRELLRASAARGQFTISARGAQGTAVSSPVDYAFSRHEPSVATFSVIGKEATVTGNAYRHTRRWLEPADVDQIEWSFGRRQAAEPLHAQIGSLRRELVADADRRHATLALDDRLREAWCDAGRLQIAGEHAVLVTLDARPHSIETSATTSPLTVQQRTSEKLPGTRGYLTVTLGDITHGQVLASLRSGDGEITAGKRSMKRNDIIEFKLGHDDYVLSLDRLVNLWIGDDFAEFSVMRRSDWEMARIDGLLREVAASELTFLRNGRRYSGDAAARHLRNKYENSRDSITTVESFIDKIATRSSLSGEEYVVERRDGTTTPLAEWLRALRDRSARSADARPAANATTHPRRTRTLI